MLNFEEHINESSYDHNRKINLLNDVLKNGWSYALKNLNAGEYPYWARFFSDELKLGMDFRASFRNVFDIKSELSSNRRFVGRDVWKYQVGRDPRAEAESDLKRSILILDRNTTKYTDTIKNWIANNTES